MALPWWIWLLVAAGLVARVVEENWRKQRKAAHRVYLRSAEWKSRRTSALDRAGDRCMDCGSTSNLHVHHLTYKRWHDERPDDLRVLCRRCHGRRHRTGGRQEDLADRLIAWLRSS
jgi:5-methylcytosine-specific restriction endonuclease McrA